MELGSCVRWLLHGIRVYQLALTIRVLLQEILIGLIIHIHRSVWKSHVISRSLRVLPHWRRWPRLQGHRVSLLVDADAVGHLEGVKLGLVLNLHLLPVFHLLDQLVNIQELDVLASRLSRVEALLQLPGLELGALGCAVGAGGLCADALNLSDLAGGCRGRLRKLPSPMGLLQLPLGNDLAAVAFDSLRFLLVQLVLLLQVC